MQKKIPGLCGLALAALLGTALPSWAVSQPPAVPFGCVGVGDYRYEDVWQICPKRKTCWRWNGYWGLDNLAGGWVNCHSRDAVGDPPKDPCREEGKGQLTCDGRVITCSETACR